MSSNLPKRPRPGGNQPQRPSPDRKLPNPRKRPEQGGASEARPLPQRRTGQTSQRRQPPTAPNRPGLPQRSPAKKTTPVPDKPVRPQTGKPPVRKKLRPAETVAPSTPQRKAESREEYETPPTLQPDPQRTPHVYEEEPSAPVDFAYDDSQIDDSEEAVEEATEFLNPDSDPEPEPASVPRMEMSSTSTSDVPAEAVKLDLSHQENPVPHIPAQKKRRGKQKPPTESNKQTKSAMRGSRGRVFGFRIFILVLIVILFGVGIKNTFFPPKIPGPDQVVAVVNEENNRLGFPVGEGSTFVQEFAVAYLTVDPNDERSPEERMAKYVAPNQIGSIIASVGNMDDGAQTVTGGPFISPDVRQVDEFNAVFTVASEINGKWIYLDVPVRTGEDKSSFVVSGAPAFVSPPANMPEYVPDTETRTNDLELTIEVTPDIESFFRAWGASDSDALSRLIAPDSTPEVSLGLRDAVEFGTLSNIRVFSPDDGGNPNIRQGTATVVWITVKGEQDRNTTYSQRYNFTIEKLDDQRWYVKDVQSGVTTQT